MDWDRKRRIKIFSSEPSKFSRKSGLKTSKQLNLPDSDIGYNRHEDIPRAETSKTRGIKFFRSRRRFQIVRLDFLENGASSRKILSLRGFYLSPDVEWPLVNFLSPLEHSCIQVIPKETKDLIRIKILSFFLLDVLLLRTRLITSQARHLAFSVRRQKNRIFCATTCQSIPIQPPRELKECFRFARSFKDNLLRK